MALLKHLAKVRDYRNWPAREKAFWLRVEKRRKANVTASAARKRNRK